MPFDAWLGYAYDVPSGHSPDAVYPGPELDLRRLLYARALTQIEKRSGDPEFSYARDYSALWDVRTCGRGSGLVRACEGEHRFFTPLGCGSRWCLRCLGLAADMRASRVHRDLMVIADACAVLSAARVPVVRVVLTLSDPARRAVARADRDGANDLLRHARRILVGAAGSDGSMPMMLTFHPTSSTQPWLKRPHVEAFALWSDVGDHGASPIPWAENGPVDVDAVRESWSSIYPGSTVLQASYYRFDTSRERYERPGRQKAQTLAGALRYALRPFQEDVWWAVSERRLGVPGGEMHELLNCWREPTLRGSGSTSSEVIDGLEGSGGVLLWPRWHRVRRYGALAARGFSSRVSALYAAIGQDAPDWSPVCLCPECGERLACKMEEDEEGRRWPILLRPSEAAMGQWEDSPLALLPGSGKPQGVVG